MGHHANSNAPAVPRIPENHPWRRIPRMAGIVGIVGIVASIGLGLADAAQFYYSYLTAYMYFLSIALGGLFFVLVHHATQSGWGVAVRRLAEDLMGTLPLFALLFIPVAAGLLQHHLFHHWTDAAAMAEDPILQGKAAFLNTPFFFIRAAFYLAVWTVLARWFRARSVEQDTTGDHDLTRLMLRRSFPGLILFVLTMSFASMDWIMSHNPHWYSTMYGVYYFAGVGLSVYAVLSILTVVMPRKGLLKDTFTVEHRHACGKMTFGFTCFWAYIAFSQFMLIWYANIPEETLWFAARMEGGWRSVSILLMVGHFAIPFLFLIMRTTKRIESTLLAGAVWLMIMHYVDLHWQIMPNLHHAFAPHIMDITTFVGIGGLFVAAFMKLVCEESMVPVKDPRLPESLAFENL